MRLDIDDNNLHDMLQGKKDYIGESWINGIVNTIAGISFTVTIYSAKISLLWVNILLYLISISLIVIGCIQLWKNTGKRLYDYEKLYDDIKKLSVSESKYSLVAILNEFEGDSANKVLLRYFDEGWNTYMFLSYRSAPEDDENNVISRVAASLKVARNQLEIKLLDEIPYQPKYSPSRKLVRTYHHKYYQISIKCFSDIIKQTEFTLDGVRYKWMTLDEMWADSHIKANNLDVLSVFEQYIFNTKPKSVNRNIIVPKNVFIRLNRECNLSCSFCLIKKDTQRLSLDQLKTILDTLKLKGVKKAKLTGGEPTLHPDFFEIVKYSIDLGLDTVVYSNLCITDDVIDKIKKYSVSVSTSIHGDESFHDDITQKGAYKKICTNIFNLTKAHIPVNIHMVIMKKNFKFAEDVIKTAIYVGAQKVTFQTLIPREKGVVFFENGESSEDIREMLKLLYPLKEKYKSNIQIDFSDLYEKDCYVLETDGAIYVEKENVSKDRFIGELI